MAPFARPPLRPSVWLLALAALLAAFWARDVHAAKQDVVALTDENFDTLVAEGRWLVKFYAPWCGHCKQLAPTMERLAKEGFDGEINVGKVDCTKESNLQSRFNVRGYPTLEYFENGEKLTTYSGPRDFASLVAFGSKMKSPSIRYENDPAALKRYLTESSKERNIDEDSVSFVILSDDKLVAGSAELESIELVASNLRPDVTFVVTSARDVVCEGTKIEACTSARARLVRYEPRQPLRVYEGELKDSVELQIWVAQNRLPLIPTFGMSTYQEISKQDKLVVFCAFYKPGMQSHKGRLRTIASDAYLNKVTKIVSGEIALPPGVRDRFLFVRIDGAKWASYLSNYNLEVLDLPLTLVMDYKNQHFYENQELERAIGLEAFLTKVANGEVEAQTLDWIHSIKWYFRAFIRGMPLSGIVAFFVVMIVGMFTYLLCVSDFDVADDLGEEDAGAQAGPTKASEAKKAD